jgi:hypothetical protein
VYAMIQSIKERNITVKGVGIEQSLAQGRI